MIGFLGKGKMIAFVGDSLGRQQFQSLMLPNVGWKYGLTKPFGAVRPNGWAYWFPHTDTTIYITDQQPCVIEHININDPSTDFAMHLDRPPAFLKQYIHQFDVLLLNTGQASWSRVKFRENRWVMHVNGKPIEARDSRASDLGVRFGGVTSLEEVRASIELGFGVLAHLRHFHGMRICIGWYRNSCHRKGV
ncbi:hypothetical protein Vadar_009015 [Vaccinium darrowii]|uniref:Uncharacterized protein n=1 Tax=Vaccinium darrowii TaxID=229202 RepID=A0ACB7X8Y3_9ERIC|nr:hypothetical protein Vadar_009015 [Vaccinium darrowii]